MSAVVASKVATYSRYVGGFRARQRGRSLVDVFVLDLVGAALLCGGVAALVLAFRARIATLVITEAMVKMGEKELKADGTPNCCGDPEIDKPLEDACAWMGRNFSVRTNPSNGQWLLYYLYGLERAGRFSGRRFFVNTRGRKLDERVRVWDAC